MKLAAIAIVVAACGGARAPAVEPARVLDHPPCTGDGPWLTIETGPLRPGCAGGVYLLDGRELGTYPVACGPARSGSHTLRVESAGDCAGYLTCPVELPDGAETVLDLRAGCGLSVRKPDNAP